MRNTTFKPPNEARGQLHRAELPLRMEARFHAWNFLYLVCSRIEQTLKLGKAKAKKPSITITTVWKSFHKLRFSSEVHYSWQNLQASLETTSILLSEENLFCQMLLDRLMKYYITKQLSLLHEESPSVPSHPTITLSSREKNVVRYIAGYIIRKLKDWYKMSKKDIEIQQKDLRYVHILTRMQTDRELEYSYADETCEWTELLDRGGLFHVTCEAYIPHF